MASIIQEDRFLLWHLFVKNISLPSIDNHRFRGSSYLIDLAAHDGLSHKIHLNYSEPFSLRFKFFSNETIDNCRDTTVCFAYFDLRGHTEILGLDEHFYVEKTLTYC
jgi:hypothetical protein